MVTFNPRKRNEKGVGHVNVEDTQGPSNKGKGISKPVIIGAAGVAVAGLATAFMLATGSPDDDQISPPSSSPAPIEMTETQIPPAQTPPVVVVPDTTPAYPSVTELDQASIVAKQQAIYISPDLRPEYDAYITEHGRSGQRGQDFATHVSLSYPGSISVLITEGPYAGIRVGFFPAGVNGRGGDGQVVVERVGVIQNAQTGANSQHPVFTLLPRSGQIRVTQNMESPSARGREVALPDHAAQYTRTVSENGRNLTAFAVSGQPAQDGVFSVQLFNEDVYSIDLNTGDFTVNSAFAYDPDYLETGVTINADNIPWVDGRIDMRPILSYTPSASTTFKLRP